MGLILFSSTGRCAERSQQRLLQVEHKLAKMKEWIKIYAEHAAILEAERIAALRVQYLRDQQATITLCHQKRKLEDEEEKKAKDRLEKIKFEEEKKSMESIALGGNPEDFLDLLEDIAEGEAREKRRIKIEDELEMPELQDIYDMIPPEDFNPPAEQKDVIPVIHTTPAERTPVVQTPPTRPPSIPGQEGEEDHKHIENAAEIEKQNKEKRRKAGQKAAQTRQENPAQFVKELRAAGIPQKEIDDLALEMGNLQTNEAPP